EIVYQIHLGHAAPSELALKPVVGGQRGREAVLKIRPGPRLGGRGLQVAAGTRVGPEQRLDFLTERSIVSARLIEEGRALGRLTPQSLRERGAPFSPARGVHPPLSHRSARASTTRGPPAIAASRSPARCPAPQQSPRSRAPRSSG